MNLVDSANHFQQIRQFVSQSDYEEIDKNPFLPH